MKRRMTEQQEFEIMKLVLDKFLWVGFIIMGYGTWKMIEESSFTAGIYHLVLGVAVLLVFLILVVKEYEIIK